MKYNIFAQNRTKIKECLGIDDFVADMLEGECNRELSVTWLIKHPFLSYSLLSIISNILFPIWGVKRKVVSEKDDFIFISCPDPIFRTKTIDLISGKLKYSIIYLPNFHISVAIRYYKYFKNKGVCSFFPTIKLYDIVSAYIKMNRLRLMMKKQLMNDDYYEFIYVLSSYLIYDGVAKRYLSQVAFFNGKWILEHQKFYFMASVANLYQRGWNSTMLQHGIFFKTVYDFIPLVCNKVLCCSEREKKIYVDNGILAERVEVFGAPLQTLERSDKSVSTGKHYDILVMMTMIDETNLEFTREVLEHIKSHYSSVLVRMRPRSRRGDMEMLFDTIKGMELSPEGTPIGDDILRCSKAVSFSVDANIELSKFRKPFIFIWNQGNQESVKELNCATVDNYKEEIQRMMKSDFYSTFDEKQYKDILGETDVDVLRDRFEKYIKS